MQHPFIRAILATGLLAAACGAGAGESDTQEVSAEPHAHVPVPVPMVESAVADAAPPAEAAAPLPHVQLQFHSGQYKPGFERLRVVRREHTQNQVAKQVALNVGLAILTGGASFAAAPFSKDDLAGAEVVELAADPMAANPAMTDLRERLGTVATEIYRRRASQVQDGAGRADMPAYAKAALTPGDWHLVYENLAGQDEQYRLKFGAQLGSGGFLRKPASCRYASEPMGWASWQADGWQALRIERDKAVAHCAQALAATPEQYW